MSDEGPMALVNEAMVGRWVLAKDMNPATNIYGRRYMDNLGNEHIWHDGSIAAPKAWYFPPEGAPHD
jgi:hypothetical protein